MPGQYAIERGSSGQLRVVLQGAIDEGAVTACGAKLNEALAGATPARVLFDLCLVSSLSTDARHALAELQRTLAPKVARTAYLANRPFLRGEALWVVHMADDSNAKPAMNERQAEQWLAGTQGRLEEIVQSTVTALAQAGTKKGGAR